MQIMLKNYDTYLNLKLKKKEYYKVKYFKFYELL